MKKMTLGFVLMAVSMVSIAGGFVHPLKFDGSEAQKQQVIRYIEQRVQSTYCDSGLDMCQPTTLRMMEKQNLKAFKELTGVTNASVLATVIDTYCDPGLDMCDYNTIWMMYRQNNKASKEKLGW